MLGTVSQQWEKYGAQGAKGAGHGARKEPGMAMDKAGGAAGGGCGGVPGGYSYIYPMAAGAEKTVYASYTAQTGDIATTMSFNAQISAIHTETLQNSGEAHREQHLCYPGPGGKGGG